MKQNFDYTDIKNNLENIYKTTLCIKKKINEIEQTSNRDKEKIKEKKHYFKEKNTSWYFIM